MLALLVVELFLRRCGAAIFALALDQVRQLTLVLRDIGGPTVRSVRSRVGAEH